VLSFGPIRAVLLCADTKKLLVKLSEGYRFWQAPLIIIIYVVLFKCAKKLSCIHAYSKLDLFLLISSY